MVKKSNFCSYLIGFTGLKMAWTLTQIMTQVSKTLKTMEVLLFQKPNILQNIKVNTDAMHPINWEQQCQRKLISLCLVSILFFYFFIFSEMSVLLIIRLHLLMTGLHQHFFLYCCKALPKFPKENIQPAMVKEGDSVVLECNPPEGIPPRNLYWMTLGKLFF